MEYNRHNEKQRSKRHERFYNCKQAGSYFLSGYFSAGSYNSMHSLICK